MRAASHITAERRVKGSDCVATLNVALAIVLCGGLTIVGCRQPESTAPPKETQSDKQPQKPAPVPVPQDASSAAAAQKPQPPIEPATRPVPQRHHARPAQQAPEKNRTDDSASDPAKPAAAEAKGVMNFNPPNTMTLNVSSPVDVAIRRPAAEPIALIPSDDDARNKYGLTGNGPVQGVEVPVSDVMDVQLRARDAAAFTITANDGQRKSVEAGGHAEWHWTVTPLKAGHQELLLHSMRIRMLANGRALPPTDDDTKVASITVTVLPWTQRIGPATGKFLADNWKSILAYLLPGGAGAGILAGWWRKRKKKLSEPGPPQEAG